MNELNVSCEHDRYEKVLNKKKEREREKERKKGKRKKER
jgi:hypothetical protein